MELSVTLDASSSAMSTVLPTRFVDPRPAARAAIGVLGAGVLLDAHRFVFALAHRDAAELLAGLPNPGLHLVVRLATIVLFVMWVDRVWSNMIALGGRSEHPRLAVIYSFFLPPLCFFRPVQIVTELWAGSRHAATGRRTVVDRWMPILVVSWWIVFLIPPALIVTAFRSTSYEKWLRITAGEAANSVAGLLAIAIVLLVTQRQNDARLVVRRAMRDARAAANPPKPIVNPAVVTEDMPAAAPIPIAAGGRMASPPFGTAARPVERLVRTQHVRRRSLEQAIDTVPPRFWQTVLIAAGAVTAIALVTSGALLMRDVANLPVALIQLGFASIVFAAAYVLAREAPPSGEGRRLGILSIAAVAVALIQLFAIVEGLG